jgi:oligopeptide transport system substrate-binding protein
LKTVFGSDEQWQRLRTSAARVPCALVLLALLCLLSITTGCKPTPQRLEPQQIRYGVWSAPTTLDPRNVATPIDALVVSALFTGLVTTNAQGEIIPGIAQSWNVSQDGLSYIFKLRRSTWSDGTPLEAEDFVFALRRLLGTPNNLNRLDFAALANAEAIMAGRMRSSTLGVRALTPDVLEIRLDRPLPALLALLAQPAAAPVPRHIIKRYGQNWARAGRLVGNGAYLLQAVQIPKNGAEQLQLAVNPKFYAVEPEMIASITLQVMPDPATALAAFQKGQLDVLDGSLLPLDLPAEIVTRNVRQDKQWGMRYVLFNHARGPLANAAVRRALLLALSSHPENMPDRVDGLIPQNLPSYPTPARPDWADWDTAQRMQEAQRLFIEAGYSMAAPLKLVLQTTNRVDDAALLATLKAQLVGYPVMLEHKATTEALHFQALRRGDFDLARRTWVPGIDMPESFLGLFKCNARPLNYGRSCNPEADALLVEAQRVPDPAARARLLQKVEARYLEEGVALSLAPPLARTLLQDKITGWADTPSGIHTLRWLRVARTPVQQ